MKELKRPSRLISQEIEDVTLEARCPRCGGRLTISNALSSNNVCMQWRMNCGKCGEWQQLVVVNE